jgi:hypothetical protein
MAKKLRKLNKDIVDKILKFENDNKGTNSAPTKVNK